MHMRQVILASLILLLAACVPSGPQPADLLPTIKTAQVIDGPLSEYLQSSKNGMTMLQSHPAETMLLGMIDQVRACYQRIEGVATQAYSDLRIPLMAGIVVIAEQPAVDRAALDRCLAMSQQTPADKPTFALCSQAYTTTYGTKEFYAAYLALAPNMCLSLCTHLPNCPTPP